MKLPQHTTTVFLTEMYEIDNLTYYFGRDIYNVSSMKTKNSLFHQTNSKITDWYQLYINAWISKSFPPQSNIFIMMVINNED